MSGIEIHPSIGQLALEDVVATSLQANRLDPKLLYVTLRQGELWREVSRKHSPVHTNPEFSRIYDDANERVAAEVHPGNIHLVGLGPGTGLKEAKLAARLRAHGADVEFTAIDVSRDLVEEAARRLGADAGRHLVCDLAEITFVKKWLDAGDRVSPRLFTLFGLVPNLEPMFVAKLLHELLRPGDQLLVSVHLAPVAEGVGQAAAMEKILPQYNNAETLAWLRAAMEQWKLSEFMEEPAIAVSGHRRVPSIVAMAHWKTPETFLRLTQMRDFPSHAYFELFNSFRYTPDLFEDVLRQAGVRGEMLAMTACREEAIWAVRSGA